jgi:TetR/AcrR family transcriptional repressor of nem operon
VSDPQTDDAQPDRESGAGAFHGAAAEPGARPDAAHGDGRIGDTKERILEAGAELVIEKGFNGAGLAEILQRAGVPKGSFYHYFASKEEFGVALIERACGEYVDALRHILADRKRTAVQRLRGVFEWSRAECAANGPTVECVIPKLALETANLSEPVHAAVRAAYQQWSALLAQVVREGQAAGEIARRHDPDRLANVLVMLWEGAAIRMQVDRSIQPLDDFLAFVFDTLLGEPR